jgi:hypothetical protein
MCIVVLALAPRSTRRKASGGVILFRPFILVIEPVKKRVISFIDGQNLFHAVRESFGYTYPNYDVLALSKAVCSAHGWSLEEARFYTGIPDTIDDPKCVVTLPDGSTHSFLAGEEKGIDVRMALDIIRISHRKELDVAVIFSQDQDLSEVAKEIRTIAVEQNRWIKIACAFPYSPTTRNRRGIDKTDWIKIDRATYDACLDRRNYWPPKP